MVKDKEYMKKPDCTIQEIITAVAFGDLGFVAGKLKTMTCTTEIFLKLCKAAIDVSNKHTLEWLLDAYYQFWNTAVFQELYRYVRIKKNYTFYLFLDSYVDIVNAKLEAMEQANAEKPLNEQKPISFIQKIKTKLFTKKT